MDIDINDKGLWDVVADAMIQLENVPQKIIAYYKSTKKCTPKEANNIYKELIKNKEFNEYLKTYQEIAECSLISENNNTIRLKLNKIYGKALQEGKFDTAVKTLASVAKMLNIQDKQMEFKVTFSFEPRDKINLKMIEETETPREE